MDREQTIEQNLSSKPLSQGSDQTSKLYPHALNLSSRLYNYDLYKYDRANIYNINADKTLYYINVIMITSQGTKTNYKCVLRGPTHYALTRWALWTREEVSDL